MSKRKQAAKDLRKPQTNFTGQQISKSLSGSIRGLQIGLSLLLVFGAVIAITWYTSKPQRTNPQNNNTTHENLTELTRTNPENNTDKPSETNTTPLAPANSSSKFSGLLHGNSTAEPDSTTTAFLSTPKSIAQATAQQAAIDPNLDGWVSEAFHDQTMAQLKAISKLIVHPEKATPERVTSLVENNLTATTFRPSKLDVAYSDKFTNIRRSPSNNGAVAVRGADGFAEAIRNLSSSLSGTINPYVKLKNIRVELGNDHVNTLVSYEANGKTATGSIAQTATWQCQWSRGHGQAKLQAVRVRDFEEVVTKTPNSNWFVDYTYPVIGQELTFQTQLAHSMNYWLRRVERVHGIEIFSRNGIAVGDVNGDALEDVYVCQAGHLPNRLYIHNNDGTVMDISSSSGVDVLDDTSSALFLDLDNDGDQDLVLSISRHLVIFANNSQGKFDLRAKIEFNEGDVQSLVAADYDNDSKLDLYVCTDFPSRSTRAKEPTEFVYYDANDGGNNYLYRNEVDSPDGWHFRDVTTETGLNLRNRRHSLAAAWEDFDVDGDPDLYVANDYGQNCLFRNDDGKFVDVASQAGVVDHGAGMSVSWGDFNRDGNMDIYVGNMFSSAGNRITRQPTFKNDVNATTKQLYQRMAKGNTLFENLGDGTFLEVSDAAGVELGRWAWSSLFVDLNNDGWEDLLVANGFLTSEGTVDL